MQKKTLAGVIWWPHSGGRWLCRSILKNHSLIHETAMVHPWIFNTTDMMLDMDITAQVHKARSLPELKNHLAALKQSTDKGRVEGLKYYFEYIQNQYKEESEGKSIILGEVCMGSPIPKDPDMAAIYEAFPKFKTIHLVRSPMASLNSFKVRHEMDDDAAKIAGSWNALNARLRRFFEVKEEFKSQYHLVRYEDLLESPKSTIEKICNFLELPFEEKLMQSFEERWGKGTEVSIEESEKDTMIQMAENELKKYNYL